MAGKVAVDWVSGFGVVGFRRFGQPHADPGIHRRTHAGAPSGSIRPFWGLRVLGAFWGRWDGFTALGAVRALGGVLVNISSLTFFPPQRRCIPAPPRDATLTTICPRGLQVA